MEPVEGRKALQLFPALPQPVNHVVEDFGEIANLTAAYFGQIHRETAGRDLRGTLGQASERTDDEQSQKPRDQADAQHQRQHHEDRQVAEPIDLTKASVEEFQRLPPSRGRRSS